jgi:4-hydroxy-tetrahydrodipicolinate synthase
MSTRSTAADGGRPHGLWAPACTPVDRDLAPDAVRYVAHVKRLLAEGCHGVGLFGTTGEATSFSVAERQALLEAVLEAGVDAGRLMVGSGCCAHSDTLALSAHAATLGCKNLLMLPPFYYKDMSDEGLFASFAAVIDRVADTALGVYLYHFPRLSQTPITHGLVERLLAAYPQTIKGIKDSSGDPESGKSFIAAFPGLDIFPGTEAIMLDMLEAGAAGCISASANVNAPAIRQVYDAFRAGAPEVRSRQAGITAVRMVLQAAPMIPTLKQILARRLGDPAWLTLRPPLTALTAAQAAALESGLAELAFDLKAA